MAATTELGRDNHSHRLVIDTYGRPCYLLAHLK
jgi:hypothetical protein